MPATYRCLDFVFAVTANEPGLQRLVDHLYAPFASDEAPALVYNVIEWPDEGAGRFVIYANAALVRTTSDPTMALAHLVWEISRNAIERSSSLLLLHAACAEQDGQAVLLSAPSGSGKSTVVAGLVSAGLGYLTDDVSAVDPVSGVVHPYPKPLSVSRRLWSLFPQMAPRAPTADRYLGEEGFLTPADLAGTLGRPSRPRLLVSPAYSPNTPTRLSEIGRAEAVRLLVEQSFNLRIAPRHAPGLVAVVQQCRCYRLEYARLDEAVAVVRGAMDTS